MRSFHKVLALLSLLGAMLSIQSGAAFAKQLFPRIGSEAVTSLRVCFAAILLLLLFRPWKTWPTRTEVILSAIYGSALGTMNLLFYLSLERIPLGLAVALEFVGPLCLSLFHSRSKAHFLWAILAGLGIYLILPLQNLGPAIDLWGALLALAAGAAWALYIIFGRRMSETMPAGRATSFGMLAAALLVLPFGIAKAGTQLLDTSILLYGLAIAVLSSAIPYSLEMTALKQIPTRTFGLLMSLEPALAALSGWFFLAERLTHIQVLAMLCIITAAAGSTMASGTEEVTAS